MNSDLILLNEIYKNSQNAINAISELIKKADNDKIYDFLFSQIVDYRDISNNAYDMIKSYGHEPCKDSIIDKSAFFIAVKISFGNKYTNRHLARILKDGCTEGIYDITGYINSCANAEKKTRMLAYKLIETEENNIKYLKKYV